MKRYEIKRDRVEFDHIEIKNKSRLPEYTEDEIFEKALESDGNGCYVLATFDNEADARAAFPAYCNVYTRAQALCVGWAVLAWCVWIEEAEYTEDGECEQTLSYLEYHAEPFTQPEDEE